MLFYLWMDVVHSGETAHVVFASSLQRSIDAGIATRIEVFAVVAFSVDTSTIPFTFQRSVFFAAARQLRDLI